MSLLLSPGTFLLCSALPSLDCFPQTLLGGAVLLFGLFQSELVQVSHITLCLGPFSSPFTRYLTDHIQVAKCLCGCLVTSSQSYNRRRQVYPEDFCADPTICSISLEQSSSLSPHLQSIPASPVKMAIANRPSACMSLALDVPLDSRVTAILMHATVQGSLFHTAQTLPGIFSTADTDFPPRRE